MTDPTRDAPYHVLFLCTGNSARSILAEAVLREAGGARFVAHSAGSQPKGEVHPLALEALARAGMGTEGFRSKSWDEFAAPGAPELDFVFTVCDNAAGEVCPIWPGQPVTAHWGLADPAAVEGSPLERRAAFDRTLAQLRRRVGAFASLPIESLDRLTLGARLREIGTLDGATPQTLRDAADRSKA